MLRSIQRELPIFYGVLQCLQIENSLPDDWKGLILYLVDLSSAPFDQADPVNTNPTSSSQDICSRYEK